MGATRYQERRMRAAVTPKLKQLIAIEAAGSTKETANEATIKGEAAKHEPDVTTKTKRQEGEGG